MNTRASNQRSGALAVVCGGLLLWSAPQVRADVSWVCGDVTQAWGTGPCWSGGTTPGSADTVTIGGSLSVQLSGGSDHVRQLMLTGSTAGTRLQIYSNLTVDTYEEIGENGSAVVEQFGGLNAVGDSLDLGYSNDGHGQYTLVSGTLQAVNARIGILGDGRFTQQGGSAGFSGYMVVGWTGYGPGSYQLLGGSLTAYSELLGLSGAASFLQTGGTNQVGNTVAAASEKLANLGAGDAYTVGSSLAMGSFTHDSKYSLVDGRLASPFEYIGIHGSATIEQNGGTNAVDFALVLGVKEQGEGSYDLRAGTLTTGDTMIGILGSGSFVQSGGTHTIAGGTLSVGKFGAGSYTLHGGALSTFRETVGGAGQGTFVQDGGTHRVIDLLTVGANTGHFDLEGGSLTADVLNQSYFAQSGGGYSGTFTNENYLVHTGGTFEGALTNRGGVFVTGPARIAATVTNEATGIITLDQADATFTAPVTNYGTFTNTRGHASFAGGYTEHGHYASDPAVNRFTILSVGADGYVTAMTGDEFHVSVAFDNFSALPTLWNTQDAALLLDGSGDVRFSLAGADLGTAGWVDNFAWGSLALDGATLELVDGNATPGAALYVHGVIGAALSGNSVFNIVGNGMTIYYDPALAVNAYLLGQRWTLSNGGWLAPAAVPLPAAAWLLAAPLALLRRRRHSNA